MDVLGDRRNQMPFELSGFGEDGHFDAVVKKLMHSLSRELNIAEQKHRVDLMALDIQERLLLFLENQPLPRLSQNGVLFGDVKGGHDHLPRF